MSPDSGASSPTKTSSSSGYVTGTLNGEKTTFTDAAALKQNGGIADATPDAGQLAKTAAAQGSQPINTAQPNPATVNATPYTNPAPNPNTPANLDMAKASGAAPQTAAEGATAVKNVSTAAASIPTFYKPDPNSPQIIDAQGKKLSFDDYTAAGGKADFSNVQNGAPPVPNATPVTGIEAQLAQDPAYQQLLTDRAEYNSVANQQTSLMDTYNQLIKQAGLPGIDKDLLNTKRIIEGTEDDIRSEVQAAGGFATDSQVLALSSARNKQLIKNYNNLLDTKQMAMDQINTMVNLAAQDRTFALNHISQKLQIDEQLANYRDKFVQNAQEGYKNMINAVGYDGLFQSLSSSGDPNAITTVEKTLGFAPGTLGQAAQTAAEQKAKAAAQQSFDNSVKSRQLSISAGNLGLEQQKFAYQVAKDQAGKIPTEQATAQAKSNIDLAQGLLTNKALNSAVGPNYLARFSIGNQLSGAKSNFLAGVQQLTSQLTLDSLVRAKAQGATFGALSEGELNILSGSASRLNSWAIKDSSGNVTGYNTSENSFKTELDKINSFAKLDYILKGGDPTSVGVITMPDGTYWSQNSNGTLTQIK